MRLLPVKRGVKRDGELSTDQKELSDFRRLASEYGVEINKKIKELNKLSDDHEKLKLTLAEDHLKLVESYGTEASELSERIAKLNAKVLELEKSADAQKYRDLRAELDRSMLAVEEERKNLAIERENTAKGQEIAKNLLQEAEEREELAQKELEKLADSKNKLDNRELSLSQSEELFKKLCDEREQSLKDREKQIQMQEDESSAYKRSLDLLSEQLSMQSDAISRENILMKDRKAKLDSLIAYYERKTR